MIANDTDIPVGSKVAKSRTLTFAALGGLVGAAAAIPLTLALIAGDPSSTAAVLLVLTVPFGLVVGAIAGIVAATLRPEPGGPPSCRAVPGRSE